MTSLLKRFCQIIASVLLVAALLALIPVNPNVNATQTAIVVNVTSYLNVRKEPKSGSDVVGTLSPGARVTVLDTSNVGWYKISNGSLTGYCSSDYLQIEANEIVTPGSADFETSIAAFPDSYKGKLRALHEQHPNWVFTAVDCGDWSSALALETRNGVSLVPLTSDRSWLDLNERGVIDSPNWVNASDAIIAYYLDPRNMLSDNNIFQYMDLRYTASSTQINETQVRNALNGTFMANSNCNFTIDGVNFLHPFQTFVMAGNESGVNPVFLLTHVIQECGVNGSSSSNGNSGYYNLYNIGAYSNVINASRVGLSFARYGLDNAFNAKYNIPWNTAGKSCVYGAKWIADYYINKGQNTLFAMRFNLAVNSSYTRGSHQYMTALQSCASESNRMYQCYKKGGILDTVIEFKIPVFSNMPSKACAYPSALGVTGYPSANESTPTSTSTPTPVPATLAPFDPNKSGNDLDGFVSRLYEVGLGREGDAAGMAYYKYRIISGQLNGGSAALEILNSKEFTNYNYRNEDFVEILYRLFFNRNSDPEGKAAWVNVINAGVTRKQVIAAFINSNEWATICCKCGIDSGGTGTSTFVPTPTSTPRPTLTPMPGSSLPGFIPSVSGSGVSGFVKRLYTVALGRDSDPTGQAFYEYLLISRKKTGGDAAREILLSNEFAGKNYSDSDFLEVLYRVFFNRNSDASGKLFWLDAINHGMTREQVIYSFINSNEWNSICNRYGIVSGATQLSNGATSKIDPELVEPYDEETDADDSSIPSDEEIPDETIPDGQPEFSEPVDETIVVDDSDSAADESEINLDDVVDDSSNEEM